MQVCDSRTRISWLAAGLVGMLLVGCEETCREGTHRVDGQCVPEQTCGSPPPEGCDWDTPEAECTALGGRYWSMYPSRCICPSGDGGCPCQDDAECDGICIASTDPVCDQPTEGTCSVRLEELGCVCHFEHDTPSVTCYD